MKFQPATLATVSAVAAAALVGCDRRPPACADTGYAAANPRVCNTGRHGVYPYGGWMFWGAGARSGMAPASAAGVSRGGFGATAAAHGGFGE